MAGMIPQPFIDSLLSRVDIVELISSRIRLKKAGGSYKACCPFHDEKTPSFHVTPDKQLYYCFGCEASGNAINFLMAYEGRSFNEAVDELARTAGIEVPRDEQAQKFHDASLPLLKALEFAVGYYKQQLEQHPERESAQKYLDKRGLSSEIINTYQLGFAPPGWNNLTHSCASHINALIETKLINNENGKSTYDLFRDRIMFPIRNTRGKTIAFGGRTLSNDKAKYINSPESTVFHKSNEVYGIYEARKANRSIEKLLVVEGYMDVISLAQHGITYSVATLGTATNENNLRALLKYSKQLIFCFDGDTPGLKAAHKAMHNCLPLIQDGIQIQFLLLPEGEDPDTLVRREGKTAFEKRIAESRPLSSFFFDVHSEGLNLEIPEHKGLLKNRVEPEISLIASPTIKGAIKDQLFKLTRNTFNKSNFKKGNYKQTQGESGFYKRVTTPITVKRKPDISACLALYFYPNKAFEFKDQIEKGEIAAHFPATLNFSHFILSQPIKTNKELLISIATDSDNQNYFYTLFDNIEFIPLADDALKEAQDTLHKAEKEERRDSLLTKSHTQSLNSEEKEELRTLSTSDEQDT